MPGIEAAVDEFLRGLVVSGSASVLHKPGSVRLDEFPLLAHAPGQWGPGVRSEDNGTPVAELAAAFAGSGDADAVAARFGTTAAHVAQAVRYAERAGFLARP